MRAEMLHVFGTMSVYLDKFDFSVLSVQSL